MKKIAVIADYLTGANDTGVQFSKQDLATVVLMGTTHFAASDGVDVIVVDTNSRAVAPEEAYRRVAQAAGLVKGGHFDAVYKKVDSTLRGNVGVEIDAIMDTCGLELAVVAPAFPKNGRVTVGGLHLLNAAPLEATEIARDPKFPVKESYLPTLLASQSKRRVGHIGLKIVLAGEAAIQAELVRLHAEGVGIVVCDIWQDEQFGRLAGAMVKLTIPTLWVGSAGLAEYLPAALGMSGWQASRAPVAVIAGSVSNITRGQIAKLTERPDVVYVMVTPHALLTAENAKTEIERCYQAAAAAVAAGTNAVIASGYSDDIVAATTAQAKAIGLDSQQAGNLIAAGLGEIGKSLALNLSLSGLVLTGGDIAVAVCAALEATGIKVSKEVAPGIPLGALQGGLRDGLRVVTKAGAFGSEDALSKAMDFLKQ
ncbi:MAG: four-carbon acid sugar kinase family protein [Negativicutes bacterium]|nr:four-carbon acid sugar kinase family protein [Negativicutes bacterium]